MHKNSESRFQKFKYIEISCKVRYIDGKKLQAIRIKNIIEFNKLILLKMIQRDIGLRENKNRGAMQIIILSTIYFNKITIVDCDMHGY